jgi:ABC-type Zn uptake system ZnuABC Zn-binding protein ZnuA
VRTISSLILWLLLWSGVWPCGAVSTLRVVTTVAPITDMARQIGGQAIDLRGLVLQL